jgi:hypothetical protein
MSEMLNHDLAAMMTTAQLHASLGGMSQTAVEWQKPAIYQLADVDDRKAVTDLLHSGRITKVVNPIKAVAEELFEIEYPSQKDNVSKKKEFIESYSADPVVGAWVDFSRYNGQLVWYSDESTHHKLIGARDLFLVTPEEQAEKRKMRLYQAGLSVGASSVLAMQQGGGFGKLAIADFDTVGITGQNRTDYPYDHIGWKKTDSLGWRLSDRDPYIPQVHFRSGFQIADKQQIKDFAPHVIVDSIDDMLAKLQLRDVAEELHVPVIMATDLGRKVVVRVERKDLEDGKKATHFNGCVSSNKLDQLRNGVMDEEDQKKLIPSIAGVLHASPRLLSSFTNIGNTIPSYPQKGTTSRLAGVVVALMCEEIALDRPLDSGLYVVRLDKALNIGSPDNTRENARMVKEFLKKQIRTNRKQS